VTSTITCFNELPQVAHSGIIDILDESVS